MEKKDFLKQIEKEPRNYLHKAVYDKVVKGDMCPIYSCVTVYTNRKENIHENKITKVLENV